MPRYIVKLKDLYFEWSTIVDAPVSYGMTKPEFEKYYLQRHGFPDEPENKKMNESILNELAQRMERVDANGTSAFGYSSAKELLSNNRAGPKEANASIEEIYKIISEKS